MMNQMNQEVDGQSKVPHCRNFQNGEEPKEAVYDDIIGLERWNPRHHARMDMDDRAAQFAPFAALVGFDEVIGDVKAKHEAEFEKR